jgi:hypothetical protein
MKRQNHLPQIYADELEGILLFIQAASSFSVPPPDSAAASSVRA